ncbi:MAG: hypothetical protein FH748_10385 [Balneolaceae bacterium]|nr:hypothetical protein [Balneolaceae bacterium]
MSFYTCITTNTRKTTLYTGVTNDLRRRIVEHYFGRGKKTSFAEKYIKGKSRSFKPAL